MAKIILEFDGDTESDVANLAVNVVDFWSNVDDVRCTLRNHLKYGKDLTLEQVYEHVCKILDKYRLP
jgi:hypothetical protein